MTSRWREAVSILLFFAYPFTGPVVEAVHHEPAVPCTGGDATVTTHSCGDKERHIPLDHLHACIICARVTDRIATPAITYAPSVFSPVTILRFPLSTGLRASPDLFSSGKRGPPFGGA